MSRANHAPHNAAAERAVLAACIGAPEHLPLVRAFLAPPSFFLPEHAAVFEALVAMADEGRPIDLLTVGQRLVSHPPSVAVSQHELATLATGFAANAEWHAGVVAEKAILRRVARTGLDIHRAATDPAADPFECLDAVQAAYTELTGSLPSRALEPASTFVPEALAELVRAHESGQPPGIPMGFRALDSMLGGVRPGELVVIAARPSQGKSALAGCIARNVAVAGHRAALFSMEMSARQIGNRLLAAEAQVPFTSLRELTVRDEEWPRLARAGATLAKLPLHIDATPALSPADIRAKLHKLRAETGSVPALVVVDYLGLMRGEGDNRVQQVGYCSRQMKAIAMEYQTGVLLLAQLSRGVEQRNPPRPVLSDLRDSGEIEQDADAVAFIWQPARYGFAEYATMPGGPLRAMDGMAEIVVEKQRNGPLGSCWLRFEGELLRFANWHPHAPVGAEVYPTDADWRTAHEPF